MKRFAVLFALAATLFATSAAEAARVRVRVVVRGRPAVIVRPAVVVPVARPVFILR